MINKINLHIDTKVGTKIKSQTLIDLLTRVHEVALCLVAISNKPSKCPLKLISPPFIALITWEVTCAHVKPEIIQPCLTASILEIRISGLDKHPIALISLFNNKGKRLLRLRLTILQDGDIGTVVRL